MKGNLFYRHNYYQINAGGLLFYIYCNQQFLRHNNYLQEVPVSFSGFLENTNYKCFPFCPQKETV